MYYSIYMCGYFFEENMWICPVFSGNGDDNRVFYRRVYRIFNNSDIATFVVYTILQIVNGIDMSFFSGVLLSGKRRLF